MRTMLCGIAIVLSACASDGWKPLQPAPDAFIGPYLYKEKPMRPIARAPKPPKPAARVLPNKLLTYPTRPATGDGMAIDFDALPVAKELPIGYEAAAFSLTRDVLPHGCPPDEALEESTLDTLRFPSGRPFVLRIGSVTLPSTKLLDGGHFDSALDAVLGVKKIMPATWSALSPGRAADAVDVTDFEGTFDSASGRGVAQSKSEARATAVVDSVLYAYRRCTEYCVFAPGTAARREELTLIGPPAVWIGSTDETSRQALNRRAPFTRVTAPLQVGSSATLVLVALDGDVASFEKGTAPVDGTTLGAEKSWTTFTVDLVWPEGSKEPTIQLFVGHTRGDPQTIRPDLSSVFLGPETSPPPRCVLPPPFAPEPYKGYR